MYSLKEAAEAVGRGKPAILRAIQKGIISANRNIRNEWEIDPAELHRVYKPVALNTSKNVQGEHYAIANATQVVQRENVLLREQIELLKDERSDLRRRLDEDAIERRKVSEEIRRLTLLLTHQKEDNPKPEDKSNKVLWNKLFGKKGK